MAGEIDGNLRTEFSVSAFEAPGGDPYLVVLMEIAKRARAAYAKTDSYTGLARLGDSWRPRCGPARLKAWDGWGWSVSERMLCEVGEKGVTPHTQFTTASSRKILRPIKRRAAIQVLAIVALMLTDQHSVFFDKFK